MQKRRHEPTQPGNPYELTIDQHVHSRACIARFAGGDGRVFVRRHGAAPFLTVPTNGIFCAKRVWDQKSEAIFFRKIETAFQTELDITIAGRTVRWHLPISEYLSIWSIRAALAATPPEDAVIAGLGSAYHLDKDQQEKLERKGYCFVRGDVLPGRISAQVTIRRDHDVAMSYLRGVRWGVLRAPTSRHFVCPDRPVGMFFPITPTLALAAGVRNGSITSDQVDQINAEFIGGAASFVFGHPDARPQFA